MQHEILVPLDGSVRAEAILPHARAWAQATDSALHLLRVIRPPEVPDPLTGEVEPGTIPYATWEAEWRQAHSYLDAVAAPLTAAGLVAQVDIHEGDPATAIVTHAAVAPQVEGIAMTTHGRSGLDRVLFGSVAEAVIHAVPKPVLVIRARADTEPAPAAPRLPYQTILVPLDGSVVAEAALRQALPLVHAGGATLVLVVALDETSPDTLPDLSWTGATAAPPAYLAEIVAHTALPVERVQTRILTGPPAATILWCADQVGADLIAMATHGRMGLERAIHGSVALEVVRRTSRPVLLTRG